MSTRELNSDDIEKLRSLLRTSAWNDIVKAAVQARRDVMVDQLIFPSRRGDKPLSDDELRGRIAEDDWLMLRFEQAVQEFDHNQRIEEQVAASP